MNKEFAIPNGSISRRDFLKFFGLVFPTAVLAGCKMPEQEGQLQDFERIILDYFKDKGITFVENDIATLHKYINISLASNTEVELDPEALRDMYLYYELFEDKPFKYQVVKGGPEKVVTPKFKKNIHQGHVFAVNYSDGVPKEIIERFGDEYENIPAYTFFPTSNSFISLVRFPTKAEIPDLSIEYKENLTQQLMSIEACQPVLYFNTDFPYFLDNNIQSLGEQNRLLSDIICNFPSSAANYKRAGKNYEQFNTQFTPDKTFLAMKLGTKEVEFLIPPFSENKYNSLPTRQIFISKQK
jgi:hypothetical protein